MSQSQSSPCIQCGAPLKNGKCAPCLLRFALEGDPNEPVEKDAWRFGDYEVEDKIARGGMGVVYRGRQLSLNRPVAIKMILGGELAPLEAVQRFHIEAEAAAKLRHPNIVSIYDVGEWESEHYIAMELITGGSLADWGERDARTVATLMAKVARALAFAHEHGVLHRDLKPTNILLDAAGEPRLTDFGLAKLMERDQSLTISQTMLGSPGYMAPEQIAGNSNDITTLADVYGLGAVLYELLAGRAPFIGKSLIETARLVVETAPPPLPTTVPKDLRTVCGKCLEKKPADRYASAAALAEDLERFARGEPVTALPLSLPQMFWRWSRRKPAFALLLALLVLSLLMGVTGIVWQWRKAVHARAAQTMALADLEWQKIGQWLDDGDTSRALAYLADVIRQHPENQQAVMYAMSVVDHYSFPVLSGPQIVPPVALSLPACLARDGTWIGGASQDHNLHVWDVASGKEIKTFPQRSAITALDAGRAPAGLVFALEDGSLFAQATPSSPPIALMHTESSKVQQILFSADGSHLVARSKSTLEVWQTDALAMPPLILRLEEDLSGCAISVDGVRVLGWGRQHAAVWNSLTQEALVRMDAVKYFRAGAISAKGRCVALLDGPYSARTWDVDARHPLASMKTPLSPWDRVALNGDGTRLTASGTGDHLMMYDADSGALVCSSMKHHYAVQRLAASGDGSKLFSYGWDDAVNTWDANDGTALVGSIAFGTERRVAELDSSQDGERVLVDAKNDIGAPESLTVWQSTHTSPPKQHPVPGNREFDGCRLSPDGRWGCLGLLPSHRCYIYDLATDKVLLDKTANGPVYVHLFSPDQQKCYVLTGNGWLHGWSMTNGEELWPPHHESGSIRPAAISPDGTRIIAGHNDGHIRIYDTATGHLVQTLEHPEVIAVLRFAPDQSGRFVSGASNTLACVWDLHTGRKLATLAGHTDRVVSAAWSPDARCIATASYDRTARVWDAATGRSLGPPLPHLGAVSHVEFSPDGTLLATACRDGTVRLWHPFTGEPASLPMRQGNTVETVRFTPDGTYLLARDLDGFRLWDTQRGLPATIHFSEPEATSIVMDSESYRAILAPDGQHVFLGTAMNYGALWEVAHPQGTAPAWLPDFLETLALMRLVDRGASMVVDGGRLSDVKARITQDGEGEYAKWAKRVLGSTP